MALEVKYDVKIPETVKLGRVPSVEVEMLVNFLDSSHKTMALSYDDAKTANSKVGTIRAWAKRFERKDFKVYKYGTEIYVEKVPVKKQGGGRG